MRDLEAPNNGSLGHYAQAEARSPICATIYACRGAAVVSLHADSGRNVKLVVHGSVTRTLQVVFFCNTQ